MHHVENPSCRQPGLSARHRESYRDPPNFLQKQTPLMCWHTGAWWIFNSPATFGDALINCKQKDRTFPLIFFSHLLILVTLMDCPELGWPAGPLWVPSKSKQFSALQPRWVLAVFRSELFFAPADLHRPTPLMGVLCDPASQTLGVVQCWRNLSHVY